MIIKKFLSPLVTFITVTGLVLCVYPAGTSSSAPAGVCSLQVQSRFNPLVETEPFNESFIRLSLKYIMESSDISELDLLLTVWPNDGIRLMFDFRMEGGFKRPQKEKNKQTRQIPCYVLLKEGAQCRVYLAIIGPDHSIRLEKDEKTEAGLIPNQFPKDSVDNSHFFDITQDAVDLRQAAEGIQKKFDVTDGQMAIYWKVFKNIRSNTTQAIFDDFIDKLMHIQPGLVMFLKKDGLSYETGFPENPIKCTINPLHEYITMIETLFALSGDRKYQRQVLKLFDMEIKKALLHSMALYRYLSDESTRKERITQISGLSDLEEGLKPITFDYLIEGSRDERELEFILNVEDFGVTDFMSAGAEIFITVNGNLELFDVSDPVVADIIKFKRFGSDDLFGMTEHKILQDAKNYQGDRASQKILIDNYGNLYFFKPIKTGSAYASAQNIIKAREGGINTPELIYYSDDREDGPFVITRFEKDYLKILDSISTLMTKRKLDELGRQLGAMMALLLFNGIIVDPTDINNFLVREDPETHKLIVSALDLDPDDYVIGLYNKDIQSYYDLLLNLGPNPEIRRGIQEGLSGGVKLNFPQDAGLSGQGKPATEITRRGHLFPEDNFMPVSKDPNAAFAKPGNAGNTRSPKNITSSYKDFLRAMKEMLARETSSGRKICYYPGIGGVAYEADLISAVLSTDADLIIGADLEAVDHRTFVDLTQMLSDISDDVRALPEDPDLPGVYEVNFDYHGQERSIRIYYSFDATRSVPPEVQEEGIDVLYLRNPGRILSDMPNGFKSYLFSRVKNRGYCYIGGVMGDIEETREVELKKIEEEGFRLVLQGLWLEDPTYLYLDHFLYKRSQSDPGGGATSVYTGSASDASSMMLSPADEPRVLRHIQKPEELALNFLENLCSSAMTSNKLVLMFDDNIGRLEDGNPMDLIRILDELKKNSKYGRLLKNVEIAIVSSVSMPDKIRDYLREKNTEVFLFARNAERQRLKPLESLAGMNCFYIEDRDFTINAYYPFLEVVTIALSRHLYGLERVYYEIKKLGIDLIDLNIQEIVPVSGRILLFQLVPDAKRLDKQELIKQYAIQKKILSAA